MTPKSSMSDWLRALDEMMKQHGGATWFCGNIAVATIVAVEQSMSIKSNQFFESPFGIE